MTNSRSRQVRALWLAAGLLFSAGATASADSDRRTWAPPLKAYQAECASCHMAYPPGLLPATSWRRLMGGLAQHYGVNAELDDDSLREISDYLQQHAAPARTPAPPQDRITQSAWFVRKHREFSPQDWAHAAVKSAANCAACHVGAAQGDFEEDRVRLPEGLRSSWRFWRHDD